MMNIQHFLMYRKWQFHMFYLIIAVGLLRHLEILQEKWDFMLFTVVSLGPRTVPEG